MKAEYEEALERRRYTILQQAADGWTQQKIADYWRLDISRVNRIIKARETVS